MWYQCNTVVKISIHALLAESDNYNPIPWLMEHLISIHALLAESDPEYFLAWHCMSISIHALLAESDHIVGGAGNDAIHFYPRSPCGERRACLPACVVGAPISIHALLAESDTPRVLRHCTTYLFLSTLSLRRATYGRINDISRLIFLSTLSLRRATSSTPAVRSQFIHFYPRSPCGERRCPF